ncbi:ABC transporter permease [Gluconobacter oxydans]|uniref:ABC transporter permease n=1 Tax=Gluconobacter oxydans NBRC 3293 TaxID=1315969 RepID=A0A829X5C5_GLUOY|nr:ABC transporter permease [Gluconobacter oxydans]GEM15776.1 ABC transporter permease [Gluconobacter oxydans NBRC 3293]
MALQKTSGAIADVAVSPPAETRSVTFPLRPIARWGVSAFRKSIALVLLAALWEIAPRAGLVDPLFLPPLSKVLQAVWTGFASGQLGVHVLASLLRAIPGLALAIVFGVPLGLLLGVSPRLHQVFDPVLELFRNTSALALLPVFTLLLGIGESSKIIMVFYAAVWPILLGTITGLRGVDPLWIKAGRSMGLNRFDLFRKIVLPGAIPSVFTGVRLAAAAALLVLVAAEMVGSRAGLGYLINASELDFDIPGMYAAILVLSVIGSLTNSVLVSVEKRLLRWKAP